ncbi:MAG: hypothetical protein ABI193_05025 [Minicystis sp.]
MLLAGAALACKLGGSGEQESGQAAAVDPNAPSNQVTRYAGQEASDTGQSTIRQAVAARSSADYSSNVVSTIYAGTVVTRTARFGTFALIRWSGIAGLQQQGWVDTSVAFTTTPPRVFIVDAGTDFGVVATPTPTVNTPPPTTVAQPTPPPPTVATTPPPPPKTVTPPPPPPPPPKTATPPPPATGKAFKPPKLH